MAHKAIRFTDWAMALLLIFGGGYWIASSAVNATWFIDLQRTEVTNTAFGEVIHVNVRRDIKRSFYGEYSVEVRTMPDLLLACRGTSEIRYKAGSVMKQPVTLSWWAAGGTQECPDTLDVGQYVMETCHTILHPFRLLPELTRCVLSNVFSVAPISPDAAVEQIQMQKQSIESLSEQVQGLTRSLKILEGN